MFSTLTILSFRIGDDDDDDDDDYLERFFDDILGEDDDDDDEDDISPSTGLQQPAASVQQPVQAATNVVEESPAGADYPGNWLHLPTICSLLKSYELNFQTSIPGKPIAFLKKFCIWCKTWNISISKWILPSKQIPSIFSQKIKPIFRKFKFFKILLHILKPN